MFNSYITQGIGTSTTTVYTVPSSSIMIGFVISNTSNFVAQFDASITRSSTTVTLAKNRRLNNGQSADIISGSKVVLLTGDVITVTGYISNSLDCCVSVMEGVQ
jgi:hypothetical protein